MLPLDVTTTACPDNSRWVVITNGDYLYDSRFVETIYSAPPDMDAVAVDFYSRYQRPTGAGTTEESAQAA